jgi:hypothetical protein
MKHSFALGLLLSSLAWTIAVLILLVIRLWLVRPMRPAASAVCDDAPSLVPSNGAADAQFPPVYPSLGTQGAIINHPPRMWPK